MKDTERIVLGLLLVAALTYGLIQRSTASGLAEALEAANMQAQAALQEAARQEMIANNQRAAAEKFAEESRKAQLMAVQAMRDCEKRKH